jgi:hypothetical protein
VFGPTSSGETTYTSRLLRSLSHRPTGTQRHGRCHQHPLLRRPDRASFTIAWHTARDHLIHAATVIADTTIDLAGSIGRHVPANLTACPPDVYNSAQPNPRTSHQPDQLQSHHRHRHPHPNRTSTINPATKASRP